MQLKKKETKKYQKLIKFNYENIWIIVPNKKKELINKSKLYFFAKSLYFDALKFFNLDIWIKNN